MLHYNMAQLEYLAVVDKHTHSAYMYKYISIRLLVIEGESESCQLRVVQILCDSTRTVLDHNAQKQCVLMDCHRRQLEL